MKLLLLHGMGGNGRLWDGVAELSADPVFAPDLAGHGTGPHLEHYGFEAYAEALLPRLSDELGDEPVRILGHSLGGAVGIVLAAMDTTLDVRAVATVGVKTSWPDDDVALLHRVAEKGVPWFESEEEAARRYLKLSGLTGLLETDAPAVRQGIRFAEGRWRFAGDPEVYRVRPAQLAPYVARLRCPLLMASGERDAMAPPASLEHLGAPVVALPGLGHNAHVENPRSVLGLLERIPTF